MRYLDLSWNNLEGSLAPLSTLVSPNLFSIDLSHNNLSGTIPSAWFEGEGLGGLFLSHNRLSGHIPPYVGKMKIPPFAVGFVDYLLLDLSSNQFNGSVPVEVQQVSSFMLTFNLSNNNLSGPFGAGPFDGIAGGLFTSAGDYSGAIDLSNNGPLKILPGANFSGREVLALPNLTSRDPAPLVAPDLRVMQLGSDRIDPGKKLDLRAVPATCPYVTYSHGAVSDITFWEACFSSTGCVVNLVGTGSKLSTATKKEVCLNRISVFLEGDAPVVVFPFQAVGNSFLSNNRGQYRFNNSNFIDDIDLGRGGSAYTGVSFARVQDGNLCGNPEASKVVGVTYGVFAVLVLLSSAGWWVLVWSGRLPGSGKGRKRVVVLGSYAVKIGSGLLTWFDLATDIAVVAAIWGAWSAWFLLAFILAPYILSAACLARMWVETATASSLRQVRKFFFA
jgi:hypothetical protein